MLTQTDCSGKIRFGVPLDESEAQLCSSLHFFNFILGTLKASIEKYLNLKDSVEITPIDQNWIVLDCCDCHRHYSFAFLIYS